MRTLWPLSKSVNALVAFVRINRAWNGEFFATMLCQRVSKQSLARRHSLLLWVRW